jgi:hypothetical protein
MKTSLPDRIDPQQAYDDLQSREALLVCAYDDDDKCAQYPLSGAISLTEFQAQERSVPKSREIIFYCA